MISASDLKSIARARLADARTLHKAKRYDGAIYLCGYAVELALKARICRTLKWPEFPSSNAEFQGYQSLRTHDFEVLLRFTGIEARILPRYQSEWGIVTAWKPESRYHPTGTASGSDALDMINASRTLLEKL